MVCFNFYFHIFAILKTNKTKKIRYFEWNNSSLCIPRKCYSGAALLATDLSLPNGVMKIELTTAIEKVSKKKRIFLK